jgi:Ca-activated chloride channel homolog
MKNPITLSAIMALSLQSCTYSTGEHMAENDEVKPLPELKPVMVKIEQESIQDQSETVKKDIKSKSPVVFQQSRMGSTGIASGMSVSEIKEYAGTRSLAAAPKSRKKVLDYIRSANEPVNRENYVSFSTNPIKLVTETPVSTFSIDVDTGAYSNMRRLLNQGSLPDKNAVRIEEMINYFSYAYPHPDTKNQPFNVTTEIAPAPWNKNSYLLHVGLQGYEVENNALPASNLVFLVDVSGSMQSKDKLGLLKSGLKMLVKQFDKDDHISLVVYAGASGVVLEPTTGDQKAKIYSALDSLTAGGSTNGAAGIRLAYKMAKQGFIKGGINRILLATDGDFNVGTTNFNALKQLVEHERKDGVALTTLGFGSGNYNDHLMEQLADAGNGNYSYIDNLNESRKVLVEQMGATLNTIAKDVKIQIEFNPKLVSEYRLIGYENRKLKREDFNNDKVDAGEIGAGHSVTALYEITLKGSKNQRMDNLRYANPESIRKIFTDKAEKQNELAFIRLRYKQPNGQKSKLIEKVLYKNEIEASAGKTSNDFRFSAAVAAFGQQLRGAEYLEQFDYDNILELARDARGKDIFGYRGEFIQLVSLAKTLH